MTLRFTPYVGTHIGPVSIGTRITSGRSPYGQRATTTPTTRVRPAKTPRATTPTQTPHPSQAQQAINAHLRAIEAIKRQQAQATRPQPAPQPVPLYTRPTNHTTYRAVRPNGFYVCVALAMVLGTALMITLCIMASRVTPLGGMGTVTVPSVSAPAATHGAHNGAAATGGAVRK